MPFSSLFRRCSPLQILLLRSFWLLRSAIVTIASSRYGVAGCTGTGPGDYPGSLAERSEGQQPVDFAGYRAVEHRRRKEQTFVVVEAVRRRVDIAFNRGDNTVAVCVHSRDFAT